MHLQVHSFKNKSAVWFVRKVSATSHTGWVRGALHATLGTWQEKLLLLWHEDVWNVRKSLEFGLLEYPSALLVHWSCTLPGSARTEQRARSKCSKVPPCWVGKCTNMKVCVKGRAPCITALRSAHSAIKYSEYSHLLQTWPNSIEIKATTARFISLKSKLYSTVQPPLCWSQWVCKKIFWVSAFP